MDNSALNQYTYSEIFIVSYFKAHSCRQQVCAFEDKLAFFIDEEIRETAAKTLIIFF